MPNPSEPDRDNTSDSGDRGAAGGPVESEADTAVEPAAGADEKTTEGYRASDPATEVIGPGGGEQQPPIPQLQPGERRFTAPGFDAKETAIINAANDPATEVFEPGRPPGGGQSGARIATPQSDSASPRSQAAPIWATQLGLGAGDRPDHPGAGSDRDPGHCAADPQ